MELLLTIKQKTTEHKVLNRSMTMVYGKKKPSVFLELGTRIKQTDWLSQAEIERETSTYLE